MTSRCIVAWCCVAGARRWSVGTGGGGQQQASEQASEQARRRRIWRRRRRRLCAGAPRAHLDHLRRALHLPVQAGVADDARRVAHLAAHLVEPRDGAHDAALLHRGQRADLAEGHAPRPLVHHLHQAELEVLARVLARVDVAHAGVALHRARGRRDAAQVVARGLKPRRQRQPVFVFLLRSGRGGTRAGGGCVECSSRRSRV